MFQAQGREGFFGLFQHLVLGMPANGTIYKQDVGERVYRGQGYLAVGVGGEHKANLERLLTGEICGHVRSPGN